MKFYIAARFGKKKEVIRINKKLAKKGHESLSVWIQEANLKPYNKHSNKAQRAAIKCIDAIEKCDVFVLISDSRGTGMYLELGTAIMNKRLKGKPKIFVIGEYLNRSMFFFLPEVGLEKNIDDVLVSI